jgi:dTDP-4-dehydrorhamnose reductase
MKVLVFGSNGMAGHIVVKYLKQQDMQVTTVARENADLLCDIEHKGQVDQLLEYIKSESYDFVINCIGLLVKDSIARPDRAAIINGWFPHYLENYFRNSSTRIIHLSTDCVFDGSKGSYVEDDIHTEKNSYGKSKSYGEINNDKDITFRMSIIGTELKIGGSGLLNWVLTNTSMELPGWSNAYWNGLTTLQLAKCIHKYMLQSKITGVYHVVNNDVNINKYELLCKINEIFCLDKKIINTVGPKSVNKILVDTRKCIDFAIPSYDRQLVELKNFTNS